MKRIAKVICLAVVMIVWIVALATAVSECRSVGKKVEDANRECVRIQGMVDEMKLSKKQNVIQF